ncbi:MULTISPECIES: helix-turn-helix domain-containing protein [unclassified Paenibacillus]|uniref:helix-turn-helix domain-containing protein n=1 Tax=unclassified Paenibacillus TaxID=185978 RepID=UPI0002F13E2E|nr:MULTISPECIES: helix-turn-helix transcriptional regulator [unclassified Paenibacillus]MCM3342623.1 helix-turn-helix domain-containing protein [Paenibacillus sp. MER TA 81-3]
MSIGALLRELRGKRSLREIERESGVSHTYLSSLEKGYDPRTGKERKPTPDTLKKLAQVYDISYEQLMLSAGYMDMDRNDNRSLTEMLEDTLVADNDSDMNYSSHARRNPQQRTVKETRPCYELADVLQGDVPVYYRGHLLNEADCQRTLTMLDVLFPDSKHTKPEEGKPDDKQL